MATQAKSAWAIPIALLVLGGCVRWGTGEDELQADDDDGMSTTFDLPPETDGSEDTSETGDDFPWPEQWPLDPDARVVVWGKTGIPTRNLEMVENVFLYLAGVEAVGDGDGDGDATGDGDGDATGDGDGDATGDGDGDGDPEPGGSLLILWIDDCDPREDPAGCLAGNVQPFFDMVATLGTIEFKPLSLVDPLAYDVVVADFCGPVSPEQVATMLGDGAHVLVLGDYWCESAAGLSAERANELLEHLGTRFDGDVLYNHQFLVAASKQVGLLEGVPVIDAWGVALQEHIDPFQAAAGTIDGAVITSRSE
ncbi:MAG: hypothetical protein R6X02_04540 [Enhygromyxa sp.]